MQSRNILDYVQQDRFSTGLGIQVVSIEKNRAVGELTPTEEHNNPNGVMHGGCVFTLADTTAGAAAHSLHETRVTTTGGEIHYLKAIKGVSKVIATATLLRGGNRISVFEVRITDEENTLYAFGTFTYYNLNLSIAELS